MSTQATALSALLFGSLVATGVWALWPQAPRMETSPVEAAKPAAAEKTIPAPAPAAKQAAPVPAVKAPPALASCDRPVRFERNPRDTSLMTRLPDGTYTPNLNGVREPMTWTGPFSPIVAIRRTDLGVDWWVHENGMQSTITIAEGTRNGVPMREPVLQIAVPVDKVLPVAEVPKKD